MNVPVRGSTYLSDSTASTWSQADVKDQLKTEKPHAQSKLLSPTEKCKICFEQAAKHIHYGAMTCFSCRAFFRRSIQNKTASTYACRRNKDCEINLKTRKNCQYCRYQKCIEVGMKPTWVLSEEERQRRFQKSRGKQENRNESKRSSLSEDGYETAFQGVDTDKLESTIELTSELTQTVSPIEVYNEPVGQNDDPVQYSTIEQNYVPVENSSKKGLPRRCMDVKYIKVKEELSSHEVKLLTPPMPANSYSTASTPGSVVVEPNLPQPFNQSGYSVLPSKPVHQSRDMEQLLVYPREEDYEEANTRQSHELNEISELDQILTYSPIRLSNHTSPVPSFSSSLSHHSPVAAVFLHSPSEENVVANDFVEACLDPEEIYSSSDEEDYLNPIYRIQPEIDFSYEEENYLQNLVKLHNDRYRSVNFGEELIKEIIMCSLFSIPISTNAALNGYRLCIERVTRIANCVEPFRALTKSDQTALLRENSDLLVSLRGAMFFDSQKKGVDQVLISMGVDDLETIRTMFSQLLKEDNMKHIDYKTFNSVQSVGHNPNEDRYNYIQEKVGKMLHDETVGILLTFIVLFSGDFCVLSNSSLVQEAQGDYIRILERYLYSKLPRPLACFKLANSIEIITFIREMADIKKSRSICPNVRL